MYHSVEGMELDVNVCALFERRLHLLRETICFFSRGFLVITVVITYKQIKLEKSRKQPVPVLKILAVTCSMRAEEQPAVVMRHRGNFLFLSCTQG